MIRAPSGTELESQFFKAHKLLIGYVGTWGNDIMTKTLHDKITRRKQMSALKYTPDPN